MRTAWAISSAIVITAAISTGTASAAVTKTPAKAPAKAAINASPAAIYAPTSLCPGSSHPTAATITGTGFPASTAYTVTYNGRPATTVTGTTSASGGFTATLNNVDQPDGYYKVKAQAGTASAVTYVTTNGYTCVTGSGTATKLNWKWQGAGFDANTSASMLVSGKVYYATTTGSNGAFNVTFTAACPGSGNLPVSFQAYLQGQQETFGAGTFDCS
jgi:hypothetical protein